MKNITKTLAVILILINECFANEHQIKVSLTEFSFTSENSLEFSIFVSGEDQNKDLHYSFGQYFFEFNPDISNGGTLTYSIVTSELPEALRPRNPGVEKNLLRLAVNSPSGNKSVLPLINGKKGRLLIARMKLETSEDKFSDVPLNLKLSEEKFKTKVFVYDEQINKEAILINSTFTPERGSNSQVTSEMPSAFSLFQNYPNPFNPETKIRFDIPGSTGNGSVDVKLLVYDITGKMVALLVNGKYNSGSYEVTFNGNGFASGMYFYTINAGSFSKTMRMVLVK